MVASNLNVLPLCLTITPQLSPVVIQMKDGQEMEVYNNPKTYDINYAPGMTKDDIMAKNNIFLLNICVIQNFEVSLHSQ